MDPSRPSRSSPRFGALFAPLVLGAMLLIGCGGDGGKPAGDVCTARAGDPCCARNVCAAGGCCVGGVCVGKGDSCGKMPGYAAAGTCTDGRCPGCGRDSLPCCGGDDDKAVCADGSRCEATVSGHICKLCGTAGQLCCSSSPACDDGLSCDDGGTHRCR